MNGTLRSHWTEKKNKMKVLLEKSVTAKKGNLGMLKRVLKKDATSPKKYKCCASFVWYSVEQAEPQPGEVEYPTKVGSSLVPSANHSQRESRGVEEEKMDLIFGRNRTLICQGLEDIYPLRLI